MVADLAGAAAKEVVDEINAERPGTAVARRADASDTAQILRLIELAEREFGPVDLYFANAGITGAVVLGRRCAR